MYAFGLAFQIEAGATYYSLLIKWANMRLICSESKAWKRQRKQMNEGNLQVLRNILKYGWRFTKTYFLFVRGRRV